MSTRTPRNARMKRAAATAATMTIITGFAATPAAAEPARPAVWWLVPGAATITQGDYPRPTAWTLGGVEYGVADNGHLYADGTDLGTPDAAECTTTVPEPVTQPAPEPVTETVVVVQEAPRLRAKVRELRDKVRHLRAQLRAAR